MIKAVMYHYIQEYNDGLPHLNFLHVDDFVKQLDFFEKNFGFLDQASWSRFVREGYLSPADKNKVILTFDDGLACHFSYVLPELEKRGIWGIFFVSSLPLLDHDFLDVHKIHILSAAIPLSTLNSEMNEIISLDLIDNKFVDEFQDFVYLKQKNDQVLSDIKRILNYFVKESERSRLISKLFRHFDVGISSTEFYMAASEIGELIRRGMVVGSHSHSHRVLSQLDRKRQEFEISEGHSFVLGLSDNESTCFCYPYGGRHSFNADSIDILMNSRVDYAFSVESRAIEISDAVGLAKYQLPRFNCNEFMYGSVFQFR